VRNPRRKSRITRRRVRNSAKRERGPSRKISSAGSEGTVGVELEDSGVPMIEESVGFTDGNERDIYQFIQAILSVQVACAAFIFRRCGPKRHRSRFDALFSANVAPMHIPWQGSRAQSE
jgi:hypothetical protein